MPEKNEEHSLKDSPSPPNVPHNTSTKKPSCAPHKSIEHPEENNQPTQPNIKEQGINRGIMWATIIIAAANLCYLFIASLQLETMSGQLDQMITTKDATITAAIAAKSAAKTAEKTFIDGQESFNATMKEMQKQSAAMSETAKANKLSAETTRMRDRAFLHFYDRGRGPYDKEFWVIKIGLKNEGSVPARSVSVRYDFIKDSNDEGLDLWQKMHWQKMQFPSVITPKQGVETNIVIPMPLIEEIKKDFHFAIFVLLETTYFDGFHDKKRITQMSRILGFDKNKDHSLRFTASHNCTDDDCPQ